MKTRLIACLLVGAMFLTSCATIGRLFNPNDPLTGRDKSNLTMAIVAANTAKSFASVFKKQAISDGDSTLCWVAGSFEAALGLFSDLARYEDAALAGFTYDTSECPSNIKPKSEEIAQWAEVISGGVTGMAEGVISYTLISGPKAGDNFSLSECQLGARLLAAMTMLDNTTVGITKAISSGKVLVSVPATPINYSVCDPSGSLNPFGI